MSENMQIQQLDPVVEFFSPLAKDTRVSVNALIQVVVGKLQQAKGNQPVQPEELIQYAALCQNAGLNPVTTEVSPLVQRGRISLIIGVDGWTRIARTDPNFDGIEFKFSEETVRVGNNEVPKYIDTYVYFKNRSHASFWRTSFNEARRDTSPVWTSMPLQMLQNRATTNAIKRAFGLSGFVDSEDAQYIQEQENTNNQISLIKKPVKKTGAEKIREALINKQASNHQTLEQEQHAEVVPAKTNEVQL